MMRIVVGLFGLLCGGAVVAIVARYGYISASSELDGMITATLFGIIAAGGLGGQAVAVRVWRQSALWSLFIGAVSMLALVVNLSNSLGFIAGRGDVKVAERNKVREDLRRDKATLARLVRQRERMPAYTPATERSVRVAQDAVASAEAVRKAECKRRGSNCRDREADVRAAQARLLKLEGTLGLTRQAAGLERKIDALRARLGSVQAVSRDNPQAVALGRVFDLPETDAETYQQLLLAVAVELLIVAALVGFELMGREGAVVVATGRGRDETRQDRPKQVRSRAVAAGDVGAFVMDHMEPAEGHTVALGAAYSGYQKWCSSAAVQAVDRKRFEQWFTTAGKKIGLEVVKQGRELVCNDVELVA